MIGFIGVFFGVGITLNAVSAWNLTIRNPFVKFGRVFFRRGCCFCGSFLVGSFLVGVYAAKGRVDVVLGCSRFQARPHSSLTAPESCWASWGHVTPTHIRPVIKRMKIV